MNKKEMYSTPQAKTVNLKSRGLICQSPGNETESLNETILDW